MGLSGSFRLKRNRVFFPTTTLTWQVRKEPSEFKFNHNTLCLNPIMLICVSQPGVFQLPVRSKNVDCLKAPEDQFERHRR